MKKIMAMLTTVAIIAASLLQLPVSAAFSDVDDNHPYKKAVTTLSTLSVIDGYEDGTFKPDGTITRSEFTKLIVFLLGLQDISYQNYSFSDVESGFWAANYIQTAYDRGIIVGFEDETFHPHDPVTYAQALKMVVCMLGYEDFALERTATTDGWADRYIQEAGSLGLVNGISGTEFYANASRGLVAQVLYNALKISMNENNGFSWVKTDKTLLENYLKVKELKGTLVGVDQDITEDCTVTLPEQHIDILSNSGEEILIDYSTYTTQASDLSKYLGNTITVYYRQLTENDERSLISIDAETTKNSVLNLSSLDLGSYDNGTLRYFDKNGKSKSIKIKNDITVRYNGKVVSADETVKIGDETYSRGEALSIWLNPDMEDSIYGNITVTDNGDDGTYDMIQIYNYETIVALSAPSSTDYRITDKLVTGNYRILDPQSSSYTYTITKDGAEIPVTSISANDVVLFAKSLDEELYTLIVTNKVVTGQISSISSDNTSMRIADKDYQIGKNCESYIHDKTNKDLKVGATGTFYLDAFDTVVYGTLQETAVVPYAYITNTFKEDGRFYITVYAPSVSTSEAVSYPLKSSVRVNGSTAKAETALTRIQAAAGYISDESEFADKIYGAGKMPSDTTYAQPARVKITSGEVTDVILLTTDELSTQNEDKESIAKCKDLAEYAYNNNSFTQSGKTAFSVNSSTTVIYVPANRSQKNKYAKKTPSSAFTSGEKYYLEAYDLNSSRIAGLVILYGNDGTLTTVKKDSDFSVVAKAPQEEYSSIKDDTILKINMFTGASNTVKAWNTYDTKEFKDVKVGDVVQFAYDSDNLIQGRINNIKFADVAKVLDGDDMNDGQLYNWNEEIEPTEDNNYQTMKFDYRFKRAGTSSDEMYSSSSFGMVPNSRAAVFNISQVLTDENKIYVTKNGFEEIDGAMTLDDSDYEEISVTSSTKIVRMEPERDEISRYVMDTTSDLTINDFKDAKNYGVDCSKILVFFSKGNAKLIVMYN